MTNPHDLAFSAADKVHVQKPLTKRELFTLVALHGIMSTIDESSRRDMMRRDPHENIKNLGAAAVIVADSAIDALNKPKQ